ncbi:MULTISPECIES: DUF1889 family protein [unclassified Pseudoalteromonas]|uniref:DUF1889 family protein n=1 Tax=unclassified Pseudoalteromonas TaxID=194690 RepID=UPI0004025256|nr:MULTISPECIES: DUF1889 family protein [unclassified Pseudoalteromonas]
MSNPILSDCIKALSGSLTPANGLTHPVDDSKAKCLFKALHKKGIALSEDEVLLLAIENNWPEKHAKKLADIAQRINDGRRVKIDRSTSWGETTLEKAIKNHP